MITVLKFLLFTPILCERMCVCVCVCVCGLVQVYKVVADDGKCVRYM